MSKPPYTVGNGTKGNAVSAPTVRKLIRAMDLLKKDQSWCSVAREMGITEDLLRAARERDYINMRQVQKFTRWIKDRTQRAELAELEKAG